MSDDAKKSIKKNVSENTLLSLAEKEYTQTSDGGTSISRKRTLIESEILKRKSKAHEFAEKLHEEGKDVVKPYIPSLLEGAIFVGHLMTDLDSVAGAVGAAELYGGIAARASEVNSETAFALKLWDVETPPAIEKVLVDQPEAGVCLVDHQQVSQLNKAIDIDRIVGVIDHHALQSATIVTDKPIYIDIRPWGSMRYGALHCGPLLSIPVCPLFIPAL
jgi:hypothetical protein